MSAQEEDNASVRLDLPIDRDYPPEVMMLHLEEIQLFFLAHADSGRAYTDAQMICQAIKNLQAVAVWNREDPTHRMIWTNFNNCIYEQYERMLA